jgi:hypothetical protein
MNENYEIYELIMKDDEDEVFALSLVSEPAIQQDFVFFGVNGKNVIKFATADVDKHTIVGPILIPNIKILRLKDDGTPYWVTFSKDTVQKLAQKYIKDNNANNITLEHEKPVNGVSLVESWIAESSQYDKAKAYGLNVKPGTWMGVFKVDNPTIWNDYVKTGLVKGISLEGLFTHELIKASKVEDILEKDITELTEVEAEILLGYIKNTIKKDKRYSKGETLLEESHSDYGSAVKSNAKRVLEWVDKNGWGSCLTAVGKQRCSQLAKGEPVSVDTIKRMHSFLSRHAVDIEGKSRNYSDGCGWLAYDAWGGKAGFRWSRNKLRELGLLEEQEAQPSINSTYPGEGPKSKKDYTHPALIGTKK